MSRDRRRAPLIVRLAVRFFPRAFRDEFSADMERAYLDRRAEAGGSGGIGFALRSSLDLVRSGMRERLNPAWRDAERERRSGTRGGRFVGHVVQDFRFAVRSLVRRPVFACVAMVTLALGIGANTAVFSVIDAVLLRALPYAEPEGLVKVWVGRTGARDGGRGVMSGPDTEDIAALPAFESLVGISASTGALTEGGEPEVIPTARVTDGLLSTFRLTPLMGRDIEPEDNAEGSPLVVVLGYRFWHDRLNGRADVIGSTVRFSGVSFEVVGVAPEGFDYPDHAEAWTARRLPSGCQRGCHSLATIGRLAPGSTLASASVQVAALAARLSEEYPQTNFEKRFRVVTLADDTVADVRSSLWFIQGAVSLVLLIACANVANLLMVRGETRKGELAVRTALGASRGRLAGQVVMESLVLALGGGIAGVALATLGVGFVRNMPPGVVPRTDGVSLNANVLLFTLAISVVVALIFGFGPAFLQSRTSLAGNLVSERRGGDTRGARRSRSLLLAVEVALSLLLLVGAGLVLKSFDRMYRVDLGFRPDNLTRFTLVLPTAQYETLDEISSFYSRLEEQLAALPGVESVGSVYGPPLGSGNISADALVEGRPEPEPGEEIEASMHSVTAGYAATAALPIIRGRWIDDTDRMGSTPSIVISEELSNQLFPNEDPIGRRFQVRADFGYGSPTWTVVGIVGNVRRGVTSTLRPDAYVALQQYGPTQMTVTMRTRSERALSMEQLRTVVHAMDSSLPLRDVETVNEAVARKVAPTRFYLTTLAIFAALAVVLAAVGLYGVVAYVVSRRTREIGIRMALGARRQEVVSMVLGQGARPAAAGLLAGLVLALALGRVAESLLFDVSPRDPMIMTGVTLLLAVVAMIAVLLPARRASLVDPVTALRTD